MRRSVMMMSMVAMIVSFVVWSMISPVAPQMTKAMHLSEFDKSILVATPVLLGSLFRIPIGMLTDRFGGRIVYTVLMVYLVIPLFGISFAHHFGTFVFWEILLGVAGTSFAVGIGHVSAWYPPKQQGLVLGITALGNIGTAVAGFSIPVMFLHLGFANTARVLVIPVLIMAACLWLFTRDAKSEKATLEPTVNQANAMKLDAKGFWTTSNLWVLSMFYFITFGGFVAFGNYLPTLLQSIYHMPPVSAGLRASGFVVLATALRPVGGYLADKIAPKNLLIMTFAVIAIMAAVFGFGMANMAVATIAALVISIMLGIGNGAVFKLVPTYFPHTTGKATGIIGAIGGMGGFFPPLVMGALKQATGSYLVGMLFLALSCVIALVVLLIQYRTRKSAPTKRVRVAA
ncbi:MFS transporter [Alicyclobacillus hesperidum subsp. aegles]|uniref:MFS transporter n=1 Tax=Alicyclobacillus hesperidum TaxID=89784 RepID=UPI000719265B|nr:MFS transporter [Alicyclobacillus hesperidum]KRW92464.1 hypothetical protein SD51_02865 [Alicyclobacillus tengchongensis]GLG01166.1 MFS transporter [Alicyclobacillus hesperidum subsp. aegles]